MKNSRKHKGFTVLEFLIVIAIMSILVGLILVGLTAARTNARDQEKISNLQKIALGIQQYHDICNQYPSDLDDQETCPDLQAQGATLKTIIPEIMDYHLTEWDYLVVKPVNIITLLLLSIKVIQIHVQAFTYGFSLKKVELLMQRDLIQMEPINVGLLM